MPTASSSLHPTIRQRTAASSIARRMAGRPTQASLTASGDASALLATFLAGVRRLPYAQVARSSNVHRRDYVARYVEDLAKVVDMEAIRSSGVRIGIDPLGGASVGFWHAAIERYGIAATVVSDEVDPTFRFMMADWDGRIRMDCSSPFAMSRLISLKGSFDVAFANDTDADRHGVVAGPAGLMNPNHYLAAAIAYLFGNRPGWGNGCAVGKTVVSSSAIDRVAASLGRRLYEVPVSFKWSVDGLLDGSLGFAGEESAGASFLRQDGSVWTTDKDGLILGLLAAEITAWTGTDPSAAYEQLAKAHGCVERIALEDEVQRRRVADVPHHQFRLTLYGLSMPVAEVV